MHPVAIIIGLIIALLTVIYAWTGMPLVWGIVMFLVAINIGLMILFVSVLPKWPG